MNNFEIKLKITIDFLSLEVDLFKKKVYIKQVKLNIFEFLTNKYFSDFIQSFSHKTEKITFF